VNSLWYAFTAGAMWLLHYSKYQPSNIPKGDYSMPTQARIHISDIKKLIADRDVDMSVVKLGGVYRLALPDGSSEYISDPTALFAKLEHDYPVTELVTV